MAKKKNSSTGFPKELTTVTPLSKTLSFIAFITIPVIAFFLGIRYQQSITPITDNTMPAYVQHMLPSPSVTK
jgi:hypothetical protein